MSRTVEGVLDAQGIKVALVVSRFNDFVTHRLLSGAEDCLERHGCAEDNRTIVRVPGARVCQVSRPPSVWGRDMSQTP